MDPELRALLELMEHNATKCSEHLLKALDAQTEHIDALAAWRPELEARFAKLEVSVAALQSASTAAAAASGGTPVQPPPSLAPSTSHGPFGHGVQHFPGGSPSVALESPPAPPVTGMVTVQPPLSAPVLAAMGHSPPAIAFPNFSGDNPPLWRTLEE